MQAREDWEMPAEEIAKLDRPRAIAAIANGVIEEFGRKEGLKRICEYIYRLLSEHPDDAVYLSEAALWSNTLEAVCKQRGIRFDAKEAIVTMLVTRLGSRKAERSIKRGRAVLRKSDEDRRKTFEEHVGPLSATDEVHARGMGIIWEERA